MISENIVYAGILLIGVFISAISQVMLKKASMQSYDSYIKEYLNPTVIIAYGMFVGTTVLSIFAYRGIPLSMGPVLESTSYIYITFFGATIFHERITKEKICAIFIIVIGIIVYSL